MIVVRKPPAWKAARGWKESPIITQKIASEAKPQARSTVSYAMRRMCSMSPPWVRVRRRHLGAKPPPRLSQAGVRAKLGTRSLQPDGKEIADCGQSQKGRSSEPNPQRRLGRVLLGADHALVDRRRNAAENDGGG